MEYFRMRTLGLYDFVHVSNMEGAMLKTLDKQCFRLVDTEVSLKSTINALFYKKLKSGLYKRIMEGDPNASIPISTAHCQTDQNGKVYAICNMEVTFLPGVQPVAPPAAAVAVERQSARKRPREN